MARYEFRFVVAGEGVELTEPQREAIAQAVVEAGTTQLAAAKPDIENTLSVGPVREGPIWWMYRGRPALGPLQVESFISDAFPER